MNYIVRFNAFEILNIAPFFLRNNFTYAFNILNYLFSLFIGQIRKAFMLRNSFICKKTNYNITVFSSLINNADKSWMHNIRSHPNINCLTHNLIYYFN